MALFQKQKQEKKRKGENVIGKIIYGFLLFMPLIAVGVACLYTIFNKNAYQSYSQKLTQNYSLDTTNEVQEKQQYQLTTTNNMLIGTNLDFIQIKSINVVSGTLTIPDNPYRFRIYYNVNAQSSSIQIDGDTTVYTLFSSNGSTVTQGKTFTFIANEDKQVPQYESGLFHFTYENDNSLDNVFYYQMEKLEEQDLFNWTKNTGTYTIMHNTTTLLGITNTYTPMIMTYWLLISVVYFLYDIALILIWAVHDKIHELKDAI